ncbi:MAG: hypothetical protein ACD_62C00439G0004 [uncultured bacterium]|nr:MAG: hypothetical protein ACD_62C00439G0004 [uncultured bacterium]HLD44813.1 DUF2089 family protein [bacterium]
MRDETINNNKWIGFLGEDDIVFLKRFVLCSGSLKDLAKEYGITYPTVRLRLDRIIAKVQVMDREEYADEYEQILRVQYAEEKIDATTFQTLLQAYRQINKQTGSLR